jgi:RNA polymerase sigma factor (sigma-70 family)
MRPHDDENLTRLGDILRLLQEDRNDQQAWISLYRQLWPWVLATNYRHLRGSELARDLTQRVFLDLLSSVDFQNFPDEESLLRWLATVCKNRAIDLLRHQRRWQGPDIASIPAKGDDENTIRLLTFTKALDKLPGRDRELILHILNGLSNREIALEMGIPQGSVKFRRGQALKRLAKILAP